MQLGGRTRRKTTAALPRLKSRLVRSLPSAGPVLCSFTVSTLDSDSSDRGSNPRGTSCPPRLLSFPTACFFFISHRPACCYLLLLLPFCRLGAISMLIACLLASTVLLSSFLHGVQPSPACPADSVLQHLISSGASQAQFTRPVTSISWSRGVTVSTLDSESSDRGSNPRGTSCPPRLLSFPTACFFFMSCPLLSSPMPFCRLAASSMLIASVQPVSHRVIFRTP